MSIEHDKLVKRVIELSGGKEKLNNDMDCKLAKINEKWNQNIDSIGRILRAHLFVEHFMTECLASFNPNLGDVNEARLTFAQKLALIEGYSLETIELSKGIRRLNKIRNQMAHNLAGMVTDQDKELFLSVTTFKALRNELAKPNLPSDDNLVVLEDFAKHVGARLASLSDPDPLSKRFELAFNEQVKKT